ncbi:helix-turn-helix domain-containing protein [Streptomyces sp. NPDC058595]|uniref:helix-turn-helix domain-containing protein n=1 Tax=Streptomyces sp. NPDC058595 TaxID=3346550 RepID=UPI0036619137
MLDAADELFSRDGIARTSVDQVLHHAHVAPGTLYAHFEGSGYSPRSPLPATPSSRSAWAGPPRGWRDWPCRYASRR